MARRCAVAGAKRRKLLRRHTAERAQGLGEIGGGLEALLGLLGQRARHHGVELGREALVGHALAEPDDRFGDVLLDVLHRRLGRKRQLAGQHFVQDHGQRIDVTARVERFALGLFGRHELGRAEHHALLGEDQRARLHLSLGHLGQAEIEDLRIILPVLTRQENVLGLEIPVHDAQIVSFLQRAADLNQDRNRALSRDGAVLAHGLIEILALEHLHHDVQRAVFFHLPVHEHLHGVRVRQLAHGARLAAKARREVFAIG